MASTIQINPAHETLLGVIRRVRARWRLKLALRGAAIVLGALVIAVLAGAWVMQTARFAPGAITGVRIGAYLLLAALFVQYVVRPLLRRASDEHVALYLEEHEPSLDAAVLSAVEHGALTEDTPDRSPLLTRRLVENAIERSRAVNDGARVDQPGILRAAMFAGGAALVGLITLGIGPTFLREGARLLLAPWRSAEAAQPYAISVLPGNVTVAKGGDQEVSATLRGFTAEGVQLAVRRGAAAEWDHVPMTARGDSAHFSIRLFDIAERTEYYVESNGVRSALFRIDVANLPYVKKIDLEYRYPGFTGMATETVADGGDIAAPRGTTVIVHATTTMPVKGGRLLIEGKPPTPLTLNGDGTLTAPIQVTANGFYKLELETQSGDFIPGSLDYTIDVLDDRPPTIKFEKPGRDTKVTAVDEVFTQVQATDDYGVSNIDLMYSVNGGPEKTVALQSGGKRLREVVAGHTFFLEELGLKPGDLISYYARAKDNGGNGQEAKTDIYFMTVRPFDQTYKQSEQAGGGGGGGDDPGELTERQRQVVAGTFNVERDRKTMPASRLRENFATLNLSQGRIREAVETLMRRIMERNITAVDTAFKIIAEELPQAAKEMQAAEEQLLARNSTEALPPEQRALQHLQRAEAAFKEYQITRGQSQGGGGNQQSKAEDLADLFELDADKLRNQYETVDRGTQQQQADNQVDETAEKLKQLSSRLQQENERLKNGMQGQQGQQSGGGGGGQRQLADEAEQMARQLERLVRENPTNANNDQISESARRLQEAANAMRRSATGANDGGVAQGASALDKLQEARRLLDENRNARTARDLDDAVKKAEKIANDQREIANAVDKLGNGAATGSVDAAEANRLTGRQKEMETDVRQLEGQLDRMRRDSQKDHAEASRKMQEALTSMRENRLADRVQASQRLTQALAQRRTTPDYAKQFESAITEGVEEMRQKVNEAAAASRGEGDKQATSKSLDRARDLVRGQESLADRMRQRRLGDGGDQSDTSRTGAQGSRGAQGNQQGQSGQQNAQGGQQNAQQGANGQQPGQTGSQGQRGGQQQGQAGQQQGQSGSQQGQAGQQQGQGQQGQGQQGQSGQQGQGQSGQQGQQGQQGGGQQQGQGGQMGGGGSQSNQQGPGGRLGGNQQGGVPNGRLSADDIRQFSREFRDQRQSAEQLKRELQEMGVDPSDLNRMIEQMRQLESGKNYDDPIALERLQQSLIEGLMAFEFARRRQVEGNDRGRPVLGASGDVPAGFRQMVDEYYRSLSKKPQK
jgi:hypothetical protein